MTHGHANDSEGVISSFTQQRLDKALQIKQQQPQAMLIASGGLGYFNQTDIPHAAHIRHYLQSKGIDKTEIIQFDTPQHTVDEIICLRDLLVPCNNPECWVISSDFHMARVEFICRCLIKNAILDFISASSKGSDQAARQRAIEHEKVSFGRLKQQKGVVLEGILWPDSSENIE